MSSRMLVRVLCMSRRQEGGVRVMMKGLHKKRVAVSQAKGETRGRR